MNQSKWVTALAALALMAGTAGLLAHLKANQKLGEPGVKTRPLTGGRRLEIVLPERVLEYTSEPVEADALVTNALPKDTSYGQRHYTAPDGFQVRVNVVLMGSDRTSIHKPQFCLRGQGWAIEEGRSGTASVRIERPRPYDLPVMKLLTTKQGMTEDGPVIVRGIYVYWFVARDRFTAQHWQRMWWMSEDLLRRGVLERWAYVTCFSTCAPGQEDTTFERMKKLIAAAVPEFQLTPRANPAAAAPRP